MRALHLLSAGLVSGSLLSCGYCGIGPAEPEIYTGGTVSPSGMTYQTTSIGEDFLPFPSGHTYDLVHGLGAPPTSVHGYVSFIPQLTEDGDPYDRFTPNNLSESAGNEMVIERWDDEVIRIRNDTCAEFYVRVVAYLDGPTALGAAGAGPE